MSLDKWAHLLAGWAIAASLMGLGWEIAIGAAVLIGGAKEIGDGRLWSGNCDPMDFLVTSSGGVMGAAAVTSIALIAG